MEQVTAVDHFTRAFAHSAPRFETGVIRQDSLRLAINSFFRRPTL